MQEPKTGQLTRRVHVHCYSEVNRRYNVTFGELNLKYLLIVQRWAMIQLHVHSLHFKSNPNAIFSFCFLKEPIQGHIRTQILSELKDLRDVSDLLSMLEMAIGFLCRAGGNPEMKISDYLKTVLLLSEGKSSLKSKKVGNEC